jgi:hypothetical protein
MSQMKRIFTAKARQLRFHVDISLPDLSNVPLLEGEYQIKWKLKAASVQHGKTHKWVLYQYGPYLSLLSNRIPGIEPKWRTIRWYGMRTLHRM